MTRYVSYLLFCVGVCLAALNSSGCARFDPTSLHDARALPAKTIEASLNIGLLHNYNHGVSDFGDTLRDIYRDYLSVDNHIIGNRYAIRYGVGWNSEITVSGGLTSEKSFPGTPYDLYNRDSEYLFNVKVAYKKSWQLGPRSHIAVAPTFVHNQDAWNENDYGGILEGRLWIGSKTQSWELPVIIDHDTSDDPESPRWVLTLRSAFTTLDRKVWYRDTSTVPSTGVIYDPDKVNIARLGIIGGISSSLAGGTVMLEAGCDLMMYNSTVKVLPVLGLKLGLIQAND